MPIIEYSCKDCGEKFEELVRSAIEIVECPACRGKNSERIMSTFAFKTDRGRFSPSAGSACSSCKPISTSACSGCGK